MHNVARAGGQVFSRLVLIVLVFVTFVCTTPAQDVCPIKKVKTNSLSGRVVENSKNGTGWPEVVVTVLSRKEERVIVTGKTDSTGAFRFDTIGKGIYFLEVNPKVFSTYRLIVEIKETRLQKGGGILVKLDPDCGKTEVLLGK